MFLEYNMNITENSFSYNMQRTALSEASPIFLVSSGFLECKRGYYTKRSGLEEYLLLYTIDGEGCINYGGREYQLKKNTLCIINCNEYQEYRTTYPQWKFYYMHICGDSFEKMFKLIYKNDICYEYVLNSDECQAIIHNIIALKILDTSDKYVSLNLHIAQLLNFINSENIRSNPLKSSNNKIVNTMIGYIQENYMTDINLDKICNKINVSKFHMIRLFKSITSVTPYEYIMHLKIQYAKRLLRTTDLTVEQITEKISYLNVSSFIRAFRAKTGVTPLNFRNNIDKI